MTLVGMTEAGRRAGMTKDGIRRALQRAEVSLVEINPRAFAVDEEDLAAFISKRGESPGPGRPKGAKNKPKPNAGPDCGGDDNAE